jgi:hypothetical protein
VRENMLSIRLIIILLFFNCLSLTPPTITFTQTPTAAEKQMLGEGKDIEKDGWILSSVRTSTTGSEVWEREHLEKDLLGIVSKDELFVHYRKLSYYAGDVREFKKKGFIGETLSGKIAINPKYGESIFRKEFPLQKERIDEVIRLVNESRVWVVQKRIAQLANYNLKPEDYQKRKRKIESSFYEMVESGEFFEYKIGAWKVKE